VRADTPADPGPPADPEESLEELCALAATAGAHVAERILQSREAPDAATLIGGGKVETLKQHIALHQASLVIFDAELSATQLRNLERALEVRVVDRTQLILDIFASRARTREGQLQVELAQLNYLLPRLAGRGAQMSRLGGGIGTRGPGETQLETDRRKIARRIQRIEGDLKGVRRGRAIQRLQRQSVPLATLALAGYTNAGKSTLFNRLTGADVVADSRLFATLDPTVRHITLPSRRRVLVSDTVGFIRNLPTTLVEAFRATLEEVVEARVILHVVDGSSAAAVEHMAHVRKVLDEIGAGGTPQLLVVNKCDAEPRSTVHLEPGSVRVSARTGEGMEALFDAIDRLLPLDPVAPATYRLPAGDGASLHLLHECARVERVVYRSEECEVVTQSPESVRRRLARYLVQG
jgi:GTP-binding protein HflX